jgi:hypothetical protein
MVSGRGSPADGNRIHEPDAVVWGKRRNIQLFVGILESELVPAVHRQSAESHRPVIVVTARFPSEAVNVRNNYVSPPREQFPPLGMRHPVRREVPLNG